MLYQLQVLSDQLTSTNKKRQELVELRDQNTRDYEMLRQLLNQQNEGLQEASLLRDSVYHELYDVAQRITKVKSRQLEVQSKINYRVEVKLDRQLTSFQHTQHAKFRELNQLLWRIGEPLRHPTYLKAAFEGLEEHMRLMDAEHKLQRAFAGYDLTEEALAHDMTVSEYLGAQCLIAAEQLKKVGGVVRYNQLLSLSEASCRELTEGGFDALISEELKLMESPSAEQEARHEARDQVRHVQLHFTAACKSFSRLDEPRPKTYEATLREAATLSDQERQELLEPLLPLCLEGAPAKPMAPLCDQFKSDYTINPRGLLHVAQEKFDRLLALRHRMDRVEELQERELRTDEGHMAEKLGLQDALRKQLDPRYLGRFERLMKVRDFRAVASVHRINDSESSCSACLVTIPPSLRQQVRRQAELCTCPSCQRILVPYAHINQIKEEVDPLLVSEEERIAMEERGEIGTIPACSCCGNELKANPETGEPVTPNEELSVYCQACFSFLVPLQFEVTAQEDHA